MFFDIILSEDNKIDNNDDYPIEEYFIPLAFADICRNNYVPNKDNLPLPRNVAVEEESCLCG